MHPPAEHAEADAEPGQAAATQLQPQAPETETEQATASVTFEEPGQEDTADSQEGGPGKAAEPQQATASVTSEEPGEAGGSRQASQRSNIAGGVTAQGTKRPHIRGDEGGQQDETEQDGDADAAGEPLGTQLEAVAEAADHGQLWPSHAAVNRLIFL